MSYLITYYHLLTVEIQNDFNVIRSIEGQLPILPTDPADSSFLFIMPEKGKKNNIKQNIRRSNNYSSILIKLTLLPT